MKNNFKMQSNKKIFIVLIKNTFIDKLLGIMKQ